MSGKDSATSAVWSFGYGSNMDVEALAKKKHVELIDHCAAILKGYRMTFSQRGMRYVEPAYGNLTKSTNKEDEVHGVAFCMTKESMDRLNSQEGSSYARHDVNLEAYDGRSLIGYVYINENLKEELLPSARYLGVLIKGARQAGLKEDYIARLEKQPVYEPSKKILELRKTLPKPEDLHPISPAELAEKASEGWTSVLGYVLATDRPWMMNAHRGRDITSRMLMQLHGIPLDDNDDKGLPPYPLLSELTESELEYVTRWLDFYRAGKTEDLSDLGEIKGFLKPFHEQQTSGKSDFVLPTH